MNLGGRDGREHTGDNKVTDQLIGILSAENEGKINVLELASENWGNVEVLPGLDGSGKL